MKRFLAYSVGGVLASFVAEVFGVVDGVIITMFSFMCIDFITGLTVAVSGKSPKTENGGLSSKYGLIGLLKKSTYIFMVIMGNRLDLLVESNFIRTAVVFGIILNETISIIENIGTLGVKIPPIFYKIIESLKKKSEEELP